MALLTKRVKENKTKAIEATKEKLGGYKDFIFADFRGLSVLEITSLRKKLMESGAALKVVKNNFARIAFEELKIEGVEGFFAGPTVVAMAKEDANVAAKAVFDLAKESGKLEVKGAYVDGEVFDKAKIEAYSKVPGRKELISMLMSAMNGPARKLAATLKAYAEKKASEGAA